MTTGEKRGTNGPKTGPEANGGLLKDARGGGADTSGYWPRQTIANTKEKEKSRSH